MIQIRGTFAGSHKYTNCIRASECPLCFRCGNYSPRMAKCLKCYPHSHCECTEKSKKLAAVLTKKMKRAAYSPQQSSKPTGMEDVVKMYEKTRKIYEESGGRVDTDKLTVVEE